MKRQAPLCIGLAASVLAGGQAAPVPEGVIRDAFAGREGSLVIIDCASGAATTFRPRFAAERVAPCSTFKIWNALIGLETGIISTPDQPFYEWDGQARPIADWNKDLTLGEAFRASCVPAFQALARKIGPERMRAWIAKIEYGDRDMSAGIDVFWLPGVNRKTILISPAEQAQLMYKLVKGELSFSDTSQTVLKDLMTVRKTDNGTLFGKTGSGTDDRGQYALGWFVGHVQSGGTAHAFACALMGDDVTGRDARAMVEAILEKSGLL